MKPLDKQTELERVCNEALNDVLVDFDHTIAQTSGLFQVGPPFPGAREALQAIQDLGLRIVIFSSRLAPHTSKDPLARADQKVFIRRYMTEHKLPFDEIDSGNNGKRMGLLYIDDRGLHFNGNWDQIVPEVARRKAAENVRHSES